MTKPRFVLMPPAAAAPATVLACARAAVAAGDCASIILAAPAAFARDNVAALQGLGLAVLLQDAEPRQMHHVKADGLHLTAAKDLREVRAALKDSHILGVDCAASRHAAMEAAEAGADYVGFHQTAQVKGEPLLRWWGDIAEVPAVALDPVDAAALATLQPQRPDFVTPDARLWDSPEAARQIITALAKALS
ncbi:MAG TPA: thiamine phosphate synthase [Aestuariivirga sp.]|nr:thiamine phosphate synthase [Aestuariivirga sp.]